MAFRWAAETLQDAVILNVSFGMQGGNKNPQSNWLSALVLIGGKCRRFFQAMGDEYQGFGTRNALSSPPAGRRHYDHREQSHCSSSSGASHVTRINVHG